MAFKQYLYEFEARESDPKLPPNIIEAFLRYEVFNALGKLMEGPVPPHRIFPFGGRGTERRFVLIVLERTDEDDRTNLLEPAVYRAYGGSPSSTGTNSTPFDAVLEEAVQRHGTIKRYEYQETDVEQGIDTIEVEIDMENRLALPNHPNLRFDGDRLEVICTEVPEGYQPFVLFVSYRPFGSTADPVTDFVEPFAGITLRGNRCLLSGRKGPIGKYWWKVLLISPGGEEDGVIRLGCVPYVEGQAGGGLELTGEPD